jgi:plastocyanin
MRSGTVLLLSLSLGACTVGEVPPGGGPGGVGEGGGGGGGGGDPFGPDGGQAYRVSAAPESLDLRLNETAEFAITIASEGFTGPVTLSLEGAPATWSASFSPSETIDLSAGDEVTATLRVDVPDAGEAITAALSIGAVGALGSVEATATLAVASEILVPIAAGTGGGSHGFGTLTVRSGTTVRFLNQDGQAHQMHTDGVLPHQPTEMGTGESYAVAVETGFASFYCHIHGDGTSIGRLTVE